MGYYHSAHSNFNSERNAVLRLNNHPFIGFASLGSVLDSVNQLKWLGSAVGDVVNSVKEDQGVVGIGAFVHGLGAVPLPFSPHVDFVLENTLF